MTRITDSFNRADGPLGTTDTGQSWTNQTGTHTISSNHAIRSTGSPAISTVDPALTSFDFAIDVTINATADVTDSGFVHHFISTTNYMYCVAVDLVSFDRQIIIGKVESGVLSNLALSSTALFATGQTLRLRLVCLSSQLDAYIDNTLVVSYAMSAAEVTTFGSATPAGLFTFLNTASSFDNLVMDIAPQQAFLWPA